MDPETISMLCNPYTHESLKLIHVARPGTRIIFVDETAKLMKSLSWMPSVRKMVEEWGDRFEAPVNLVPREMKEIRIDSIVKGYFYCQWHL